MVSVHLEMSDEAHARLLAEAEDRGMGLQDYLTHSLTQNPGAPHYAGLLDHQMEAVDDSENPLSTIQDAYHQCVQIMHHDMVSLQTQLIGLQLEVVQRSLQTVQESGLAAEHYFYIAFRTDAPDVLLGDDLKAQHPETMTIVLEHQFSQLEVDDNGFSVSLWFGGVPRRIGIPYDALVAFVDPSSELQLTFPDLQPRRAPESPAAALAAEPAAAPLDAQEGSSERPGRTADGDTAAKDDAHDGAGFDDPAKPVSEVAPSEDVAGKASEKTENEEGENPGEESTGNVLSFSAFRKS